MSAVAPRVGLPYPGEHDQSGRHGPQRRSSDTVSGHFRGFSVTAAGRAPASRAATASAADNELGRAVRLRASATAPPRPRRGLRAPSCTGAPHGQSARVLCVEHLPIDFRETLWSAVASLMSRPLLKKPAGPACGHRRARRDEARRDIVMIAASPPRCLSESRTSRPRSTSRRQGHDAIMMAPPRIGSARSPVGKRSEL